MEPDSSVKNTEREGGDGDAAKRQNAEIEGIENAISSFPAPTLPVGASVSALSHVTRRRFSARVSARNVRLDVEGDGTPTPLNDSLAMKSGFFREYRKLMRDKDHPERFVEKINVLSLGVILSLRGETSFFFVSASEG